MDELEQAPEDSDSGAESGVIPDGERHSQFPH